MNSHQMLNLMKLVSMGKSSKLVTNISGRKSFDFMFSRQFDSTTTNGFIQCATKMVKNQPLHVGLMTKDNNKLYVDNILHQLISFSRFLGNESWKRHSSSLVQTCRLDLFQSSSRTLNNNNNSQKIFILSLNFDRLSFLHIRFYTTIEKRKQPQMVSYFSVRLFSFLLYACVRVFDFSKQKKTIINIKKCIK